MLHENSADNICQYYLVKPKHIDTDFINLNKISSSQVFLRVSITHKAAKNHVNSATKFIQELFEYENKMIKMERQMMNLSHHGSVH